MDNGGEYRGKEFREVCKKLSIAHKTTSPHTPEHNGVAECHNRTLQEGALTLLHDTQLPSKFWVSAIHTVNFIKNHILHHRINRSPYKAFWGKKPSIDWLQTYRCRCWALVPKATRKKGEYKLVEGIFAGYFNNSKAYKIWIPHTHTLIKARDAIFNELNHIERITIHATDDNDLPNLWTMELPITTATSSPPVHHKWMNDDALPLHIESSPLTELSQIDTDNNTRKCNAEGEYHKKGYKEVPDHAPKEFAMGPWLDPSNDSHGCSKHHQAIYAAINAVAQGEADLEHMESVFVVLADDEPANYQEATNSPDSERWKASMKKEYNTLMEYNTWELVEKPPNINIVGCRWTYHVKHDNLRQTNKLNSQLIAQGFSQILGLDFDVMYSPTIRFTSIRLILALACCYNLKL